MAETKNTSKTRILLVDDEPDSCRLTALELEKLGYDVETASDGCRALDVARDSKPDLVLMDIVLEGEMDGVATAEKMRSRYNIPVVYLTGHADDNILARAKATEPFGYIVKPFDHRELKIAVEIALYKIQMENMLKSVANELEQSNRKLIHDLSERVKHQVVDDMTDLTESQHASAEDAVPNNGNGVIVDWNELVARIGDEKTLEEIMPVYLKDNSERIEQLTAATDAGDIETIRSCAHALKGMGKNLGAERLSEATHNLECAGREGDMAAAAPLIEEVKTEFEKVASFLSRPDWVDIAKREKVITNERLFADISC